MCQRCGFEEINGNCSACQERLELSVESTKWYYYKKGNRHGPISSHLMPHTVMTGEINGETLVWEKGMSSWMRLKFTPWAFYLLTTDINLPPPVCGEYIPSVFAWGLAFVPALAWYLAHNFVYISYADMPLQRYIVTSLIIISLTTYLMLSDSMVLERAGHNTKKWGLLLWIVPFFLYQRGKELKQNRFYLIVWVILMIFEIAYKP